MSDKEKVKISSNKEEEWSKRVAECLNELYKSVGGKLLTTMEVALPNGTQLFALKSRIKDVQGTTWDEIGNIEYDIRRGFFEVSDSSQPIDPTTSIYKNEVEGFLNLLEQRIKNHLNRLERVVINLTMLVVENEEKKGALTQEIVRIISAETKNQLRKWLARAVKEVFDIK